jgi:PAS domain S-box-containing protein
MALAVRKCRPEHRDWPPFNAAMMVSPKLVPAILDSAPDAVVVADKSGTIIFANRQATVLFGYQQSELVGTNIDLLIPEHLRAQHVAHRQHYAARARVRPMGTGLDLSARRRNGSEFPVEISLSPVESEGQLLIAAAIRDVTERRHAQDELKRARIAAEAANVAKSRFLATASHDLRQPLQALSLLNGALKRSTIKEEIQEGLAQQEQAIDAMAKLLNALLDISKLESGAIKPAFADFKVSQLFQELRTEFVQLAEQKGLQLTVELCDDRVHSDPALINQLMRNLLSNAIKYTHQGSVSLRCLHEPSRVRLEVIDTGIGIPASDIPHIFEEFYQVGVPTNSSRQGYGLGLSIANRIVQLLGVSLDVQSEPGRGSSFSVALPAAAGPPQLFDVETGAPAERTEAQTNQTVLLIEDDPAVRNATRMLLKVSGYRVLVADSNRTALEQARAHPEIAVLIADYHLAAGETGMQVIAAIRTLLCKPLKAVLMTGDTSSTIQGATEDRLLRRASKPINANELLALLQELVATQG